MGVSHPVMTDGHVGGLPDDLMCIFCDDADERWKLCLFLEGPDGPETIVLQEPELGALLEQAERLLRFHEILLPEMTPAKRELEIRTLQAEYGGRPRPKAAEEIMALFGITEKAAHE
jgi:hypothetical protein